MDEYYSGSYPHAWQIPEPSMSNINAFDTASEGSSPATPTAYEQLFPTYMTMPYSTQCSYATDPNVDIHPQTYDAPSHTSSNVPMAQCDRRRRRNSLARDKEALLHAHSRRRAQNRASQRAFRDRKEKHVKTLEQQLSELEDKNKNLEHSRTNYSAEIAQLRKEIEKLATENALLRAATSDDGYSELLSPSSQAYDQRSGNLLYVDCRSPSYTSHPER
ncbi:MAG: hypothetical protein M1827_004096 [Pycnora praestabilis]|nr:MAG: hypothetical protein M1827_004096 [Pycnora praestabilis]